MKQRLLVTGGAGFIGHHFVSHLLERTDHHIVVLDSLNYAADVNRLAAIPHYDRSRVTLLWHDLRAPIAEALAQAIGPVDAIFNIASESHVERSIAAPVPFVQNNVSLALHMLEFARQAKPRLFVQISTDEVYGPSAEGTSHREWDTPLPSNPYAASKAAQEAIAISYWRTYGVPVVITNTMNNFGEHQHREKFIPLCVERILNAEPIPIHGQYNAEGRFVSGSRVWLHARHHADALLAILERCTPNTFPRHDRPIRYHIAGEREVSNLEIARSIGVMLHRSVNLQPTDFHRSRPGHDLRYSLDGSRIQQELTWTPPETFETSFARTVEWLAYEPSIR